MGYLKLVKNSTSTFSKTQTDLFAVGVFEDLKLSVIGKETDKYLDGQISVAITNGDIKGKSGETSLLYGKKKRILVVGLGEKKKFDEEAIRVAGGTVLKTAIAKKLKTVAMELFGSRNAASFSQAIAEGIILGSYQFITYKTQDKELFEVGSAEVINADAKAVKKGSIIASAVCFARDVENHPGNVTTPTKLAKLAKEIALEGDMKLTVFDREKFTKMGMGAFAGVALGTGEPPKFILLEYNGGKSNEKPIALVGKGLTFDSGGISIKPSASMDEMKFDMCGGGVVLGVMKAVAQTKPKVNIVAAIPATENLSGDKAYKPGDILTAYNGKTIEVLNTDAEGRLILADALAYVSKHYKPQYILDFATLTGAVVIALGHIATGIMGTDDKLIDKVKKSSTNTGEKVWEFPLWDEYCEQIKSEIADIKNVGAAREAGSIAAGAFLKEFVEEGIPWVHFDIAGTAYNNKESSLTYKKGASGVIIRLVLDMIQG
ncbi:leucyl aminopeptidase [bacterium]|nr:leucyl aminopeptidase [bacterium]